MSKILKRLNSVTSAKQSSNSIISESTNVTFTFTTKKEDEHYYVEIKSSSKPISYFLDDKSDLAEFKKIFMKFLNKFDEDLMSELENNGFDIY